ncbi:MAG TPA: GNAT family N-acetyltransferase [Terriglobales bacterium]|nr:GNAT family N-acetyltransferase [Terriglobales bacterium]
MPLLPYIRPSHDRDILSIRDIYAYYVLNSTASFETNPPDENEIARRRQDVLNRSLPYLVAEIDSTVVAYAYAVPYRTRAAYRFTVEDSVYVHPNHLGKGIGRLLLAALIDGCEQAWCRQMIAVIGGQDNAASVRLHESLGFRRVGVLQSVGFKLGAWADTLILQRSLGAGDATQPDEPQVSPMVP